MRLGATWTEKMNPNRQNNCLCHEPLRDFVYATRLERVQFKFVWLYRLFAGTVDVDWYSPEFGMRFVPGGRRIASRRCRPFQVGNRFSPMVGEPGLLDRFVLLGSQKT